MVWQSFATAKLKFVNISYLHVIHMVIPYQTTKLILKSANIFAMGPTTKFNSRQYFRLYGIINILGLVELYSMLFFS